LRMADAGCMNRFSGSQATGPYGQLICYPVFYFLPTSISIVSVRRRYLPVLGFEHRLPDHWSAPVIPLDRGTQFRDTMVPHFHEFITGYDVFLARFFCDCFAVR
jgi:hypothetical protein